MPIFSGSISKQYCCFNDAIHPVWYINIDDIDDIDSISTQCRWSKDTIIAFIESILSISQWKWDILESVYKNVGSSVKLLKQLLFHLG